MADGEEKGDDVRLRWLEARVNHSFRHIKAEKLKKAFSDPDNMCVWCCAVASRGAARPAPCRTTFDT